MRLVANLQVYALLAVRQPVSLIIRDAETVFSDMYASSDALAV